MVRLIGSLVCVSAILVVGTLDAQDVKTKSQIVEVKGRLKVINLEKNTITLMVADKETTFDIAKDFRILALVGRTFKKAQFQEITGGFSALKTAGDVTISVEKKDAMDMVTQVRIDGMLLKKKR